MNCVGRDNHKYFFLFLFYVTMGCIYMACFSVPPFYVITYNHKRFSKFQPKRIDSGMLSLCSVLPLTLSLAVGGMMLWHFYLLATAQTSPEFAMNCRHRLSAYKQGKKWSSEKDLGFVKNWQMRFGLENNNFWYILWLFPFCYTPSVNMYNKVDMQDEVSDIECTATYNSSNDHNDINEANNTQIQQRTPGKTQIYNV
eukprot:g9776.t1